MNTLKFKTNIDCGGCVNAVTPFLNNTRGIISWRVDTSNPDKILTVETKDIPEQDIIDAVKKAGFAIEKI